MFCQDYRPRDNLIFPYFPLTSCFDRVVGYRWAYTDGSWDKICERYSLIHTGTSTHGVTFIRLAILRVELISQAYACLGYTHVSMITNEQR
jgi:hypothetical protein